MTGLNKNLWAKLASSANTGEIGAAHLLFFYVLVMIAKPIYIMLLNLLKQRFRLNGLTLNLRREAKHSWCCHLANVSSRSSVLT